MFALAMAVTLANCIPVACRAIAAMSTQLRRQALDLPAVARLARVAQAIVQAALPALPKLDRRGKNGVAAPVRRRGDVFTKARLGVGKGLLECRAIRDHVALAGCPCTETAKQRPNGKVALRLASRNPF